MGRIYPWAHAKIVSPSDDSGTPLPVGQTGELWSGGYLVMQGYFHDPEKTKEAVLEQDGVRWMKTGGTCLERFSRPRARELTP